jgi:hypothetical protein
MLNGNFATVIWLWRRRDDSFGPGEILAPKREQSGNCCVMTALQRPRGSPEMIENLLISNI